MPSPNSSTLHISETTCIPVNDPFDRLGAIGYLAVLAYSSRSEWPLREKFARGMESWLFWQFVKAGYPKKQVKGKYRAEWRKKGGPRKFEAVATRAFDRIMTRRLPAAQMLLWVFPEELQIKWKFNSPKDGRPKILTVKLRCKEPSIPGGKRLTLNKAAEYLAGEHESSNIHRLVWRESFPVVHLALALGSELQRVNNNPIIYPNLHPFDYLIYNPSWLPRTLAQAERIRRAIPPRLSEGGHGLIQLLPTA